ncbi:MAG: M16 family metallopeptidase, partial [Gemmataceae bacterium]
DIDRVTFRAGGSNNAYTSSDMTAYHFTLPAGRWKEALAIEADRMRNIRIDKEHEFDKEKGAVINELTGNEDSPWELENKAILPRLFGPKHPYGHPVIGEAKHVRDATEAIIKDFYDRWYHPNNAALIVVGGIDPDEVMGEIRKQFGPIPAGKLPARKALPEEAPALPVRHEMPSKFSVIRMMAGFPTVKAGDEEEAALEVVEALLGSGKRSRLYRNLVEGAAVASAVQADHDPGRYPGWMSFAVELLPGKDRDDVEKRFLAELAKLRDELVPDSELQRVKQQLLAGVIFGQESTFGLANAIGRAVTLTDLDQARKYLPRVSAVTAEEVRQVARKYLKPEKSATIWSIPKESKAGAGGASRSAFSRHLARWPDEATTSFDLKQAKRVELPNGMIVLLFETRRLPIIQMSAVVRESGLFQADDQLGVAALTGMLLDEGTTNRSGTAIAEAIENVGGSLSMDEDGGSVKILAPHRKLGLDLLADCLRNPAFPEKEFSQNKARLLSSIQEMEVQPETKAAQAYRRLVYGAHPLGRPGMGTVKTVEKLTPEQCRAFHRKVFLPNNTILALAGDFDSRTVMAEIEERFGDWKKQDLPTVKRPDVPLPEKFTETILTMPQAAQLQVFLGHVGIRRKDPDFYKLLVMDHILGTGPGFTDRLSSRLRDREGLAYTVSAAITSTADLEPGLFTCYIGTDTENLEKVKKLFLEELNRIRDTKPTAEEVADAKTYLIGRRQLQFATTSGIATQLVNIERFNLGFQYLEDSVKAISAVTAEDIQAMAKKHLDPTRMILVAAGAVDKTGKPLSPAK